MREGLAAHHLVREELAGSQTACARPPNPFWPWPHVASCTHAKNLSLTDREAANLVKNLSLGSGARGRAFLTPVRNCTSNLSSCHMPYHAVSGLATARCCRRAPASTSRGIQRIR